MGVTKETISPGNGTDRPVKGDEVTIQYTGNLFDESKGQAAHYRGKQCVYSIYHFLCLNSLERVQYADKFADVDRFDTSKGRGEFRTQIGVGRVIKGNVR